MLIFTVTITCNMKIVVREIKICQLKNILIKIKPNLKETIIDLQKPDTWKIQFTITINFISSKDTNEKQAMHSKSDNI